MCESQCRNKNNTHTHKKQDNMSPPNIIKLMVMALNESDLELSDKEFKILIDEFNPVSNIWNSFSCNQDSRFQESRGEKGIVPLVFSSIDPLENLLFPVPRTLCFTD